MTEYISREELIKVLETDYNSEWRGVEGYVEGARDEYDDVLTIVCGIKAAGVQPVKRGKWQGDIKVCSECGREAYWDTDYGQQLFDYCPFCGARMIKDGKQDD